MSVQLAGTTLHNAMATPKQALGLLIHPEDMELCPEYACSSTYNTEAEKNTKRAICGFSIMRQSGPKFKLKRYSKGR